jgi:hypothetical protein
MHNILQYWVAQQSTQATTHLTHPHRPITLPWWLLIQNFVSELEDSYLSATIYRDLTRMEISENRELVAVPKAMRRL